MTPETPLPLAIAPSHVYVSAHYDWRSGWSLRVTWSALGHQGRAATEYDCLSSAELVDVVASELEHALVPAQVRASAGGAGAGLP